MRGSLVAAVRMWRSFSLLVLCWFEYWHCVVARQCVYGDIQRTRCNIPSSPWAVDAFCTKSGTCAFPDPLRFGFSVTVRYLTRHVRQSDSRAGNKFFVRGSGPGLSWDTPLELRKTGSLDTWKVTIEYELDKTSFDCSSSIHCSYNQYAVEFRIYGSEDVDDDMIGPNFFFYLPSSKSSVASDFLSPDLVALPWFDNKKITFKTLDVKNPHLFSPPIRRTKNLIALPPSFEYNTIRTYPLVIMFGIDKLLTMVQVLERGFVHDASIQEAVIVAVEYTGCLLLPYFGGKWECRDENCADNCLFCWDRERTEQCEKDEFKVQLRACAIEMACGGSGDIILDYIMNYLIEGVQRATSYRVEVAYPRHRIHIIGYDEGGLLACHAAIKYPHIFKSAACMSAPFHWPEKTFHFGYQIIQMIEDISNDHDKMSHGLLNLYQTQRYYIDTADRDAFFYPLVDGYLDAEKFTSALRETFHLGDDNIFRMNYPKFTKSHIEDPEDFAFIQRIRYALQMLLPVDGGPNRRYPRVPIEYTAGNQKIYVGSTNTSGITNTTAGSSADCSKEIVTLPIFLGVVAATMILSIAMTVLIMCLRESNQRSEDEKIGSDLDELDDSDSSMDLSD